MPGSDEASCGAQKMLNFLSSFKESSTTDDVVTRLPNVSRANKASSTKGQKPNRYAEFLIRRSIPDVLLSLSGSDQMAE